MASQYLDSFSAHKRIRISETHHYAGYPRFKKGIGASLSFYEFKDGMFIDITEQK